MSLSKNWMQTNDHSVKFPVYSTALTSFIFFADQMVEQELKLSVVLGSRKYPKY